MTKISKILALGTLILISPSPVFAANTTPAKFSDLEGVLGNFLKIALSFVGIAVLVMFVIAGFQYLSAGGDKEASTRARNTLTFAILGLILAISAWMIINILGSFLGITGLGTFSVCITAPC